MQIKIYLSRFSLLSCSGKNLKIPWKSQRKLREFSQNVEVSQKWPPPNQDGAPASPPTGENPVPLGFSCAVSKSLMQEDETFRLSI